MKRQPATMKKMISSDAGRPAKILPKVDRWCPHFTSNQVALVLFSQMEEVSVSPDIISFNALISSCKGRQWQRALKMFNAMWLGCSKSVVCWCNYLNHVKHWLIYTLAKGLAIQTVWWFQTCERNRNKKLEMGSSYPLSVDPHHFRWSVWECPSPLFR